MDRIPLIYDCDNTMGVPGRDVDDGLALLYLLGSPRVDLLAVTCSFGNSTQEVVYRNTLGLLAQWGREDIPVLRGADGPEDRSSPAASFLAEAARKKGGALRLLATGSATNLLGAWEADRGFFDRVAEISLMGGVTGPLLVGGRPMAELNFSVDPEAALAVFSRGKNVAVATAQNCLDSYFPAEECRARLAESAAPAARFLSGPLEGWFQVYEQDWNLQGFINWDVMAAAQLLRRDLFFSEESVISPTEASLGTGRLLADGPPLRVRLPRIRDREAYREHVYRAILSARIGPGEAGPGA